MVPLKLSVVITFIIGYALITFEHKVSINKAATAILTGVLCWIWSLIAGFPQNDVALVALNAHLADIAQIMLFLLGAMTIVELIDSHRGFKFITSFIATQNKRVLLWEVAFVTFFCSSILDNLTTSIIMITLLRQLIEDKKVRMVYAGMVIIAANAGGAWTPIGDVTTTMLWIGGRITSGNVIKQLFLPSLFSMLVPLIYLTYKVKRDIPAKTLSFNDEPAAYGAKRIFALGIGALIMVPVLRVSTGLPPYLGVLLGLGLMWGLTDLIHQERHFLKVPHVLTKVDISSILFFLGILLAVSALEYAGILERLTLWTDSHVGDKNIIISGVGVISSVIDNVPLTAAVMGMYDLTGYPMDSKIWEMTAYCAGTGGGLLIIGSAAGVVVMGMEKIRFSWYLKRISLSALMGYLSGLALVILWL